MQTAEYSHPHHDKTALDTPRPGGRRQVAVVNLDHGRTSTLKKSYAQDNVGAKHVCQNYTDRSDLLFMGTHPRPG